MRSLNDILIEGLADWSDDKLNKRMDELTSEEAIKNEIINWIKNNVRQIQKNKLKFDYDTTPITIDYDGDIRYVRLATSLTNDIFQWGDVGGDFDCYNCGSLKSLEGAPKYVGKNFNCSYCISLKSLEGSPEKVEGDFRCVYCESLESLEGAPKYVGMTFGCTHCISLTTLKGAPKEVGGNFYCKDCGIQFTEDDVKKVSNVKGEIYC
jgi:hypothetical protein